MITQAFIVPETIFKSNLHLEALKQSTSKTAEAGFYARSGDVSIYWQGRQIICEARTNGV